MPEFDKIGSFWAVLARCWHPPVHDVEGERCSLVPSTSHAQVVFLL